MEIILLILRSFFLGGEEFSEELIWTAMIYLLEISHFV